MGLLQTSAELLENIKKSKPLIHQLTNYVTMNDCANITLAIGASPVMANDPQEVEEMVSRAAALVINMGTLDANRVHSMLAAGRRANELGIPVILDPVGVGATALRTRTADSILKLVKLSVIRGNMSEIKHLSGLPSASHGVDSAADSTGGSEIAQKLSEKLRCVTVITGQTDIIATSEQVLKLHNGHPLLAGVTGTGCMASALIGSFCAAGNNYLAAAVGGITVMGVAGELAAGSLTEEEGLGTFRIRLFDAVSRMTPQLMLHYGKLEENHQ